MQFQYSDKFGKILKFLKILFATLIFVPILVVSVVSCTPIFVYRYFLSKAVKIFRPDISEIVSSRSMHFTKDLNELESKPRYAIVMCSLVEQGIYLDKIRSSFTENVIQRNERVRQYIVPWMGFYFWKLDTKFAIENHVNRYQKQNDKLINNENIVAVGEEICDHDEIWLTQFKKELLVKPFVKERSPWEIIFVDNYIKDNARPGQKYSLAIGRIHHSLADGYSFLNFLIEFSETPIEYPKFTIPKRSRSSEFIYYLTFIFRAPYEFVKINLDVNDNHVMKLEENEYSRILKSASTPVISLSVIKEIKTKFNVTFISVLIAGISSAMRTSLLNKQKKIPSHIYFMLPFPMLGRPLNKFDNYMGVLFLKVPIGEPDSVQRLLEINDNLLQYKFSTSPILTFYFIPLVGSLFPWMIRKVSLPKATGIVTIFPGSTKPVDLFGCTGLETSFSINMPFDSTGFAFSCLSYNGELKMEITADKSIMDSDKAAEEFLLLSIQEWDRLRMYFNK